MVYIVILAIALIIWLCTIKGDADWRRREHTEPNAPAWARFLFVAGITGGIVLCLALMGMIERGM